MAFVTMTVTTGTGLGPVAVDPDEISMMEPSGDSTVAVTLANVIATTRHGGPDVTFVPESRVIYWQGITLAEALAAVAAARALG